MIILADDLGFGDLGCYGQQNFPTPRLDRLAAEGMQFTQHYSGSTVCAPSRACLLTGQHTGHVYLRANGPYQFRPDPLDMTIARLLQRAGYHTGLIGKSGLSCNSDNGRLPNQKGFDYFFGFTSHGLAHRYYPPWLWRNGEKVEYAGNYGEEGKQYSGDLFLQEAIDYLDRHANDTFFLHLALQQPHADLNVPDRWKAPFLGRYEERPTSGEYYRREEHPKATYAGMVTYLDHSVGQILDKLRELGIAEKTLVVFSSDNGAMSEGGWQRTYFDSSGHLRGGKRDLYEGGIRVPMIAWWPGTIEAGTVSDHISAFWDFVPTACQLAGIEPPSVTDGVSFLPTLLRRGHQQEHSYLYWEFHEQGGKQAVRQARWKAVRLNVQRDPTGAVELYDLTADLGETRDVAAMYPSVVARLKGIMSTARDESGCLNYDTKQ